MTFFTRQQIPTLVSDALYQAERELLSAQHNLEHYESVVTMLKKRISRLKSATPQPVAAPSKEPQHGNQEILSSHSSSAPRGPGRHGLAGQAPQLASIHAEEGSLAAGAEQKRR